MYQDLGVFEIRFDGGVEYVHTRLVARVADDVLPVVWPRAPRSLYPWEKVSDRLDYEADKEEILSDHLDRLAESRGRFRW